MKRLFEAYKEIDGVSTWTVLFYAVVATMLYYLLGVAFMRGVTFFDGGFIDAIFYIVGLFVLFVFSTVLLLEIAGRVGAAILKAIAHKPETDGEVESA